MIVPVPLIGAGLIGEHARRVGLRGVLQVVVEERLHHRAAKPARGVAFELDHADAPPFPPTLAVIPGTEHEVQILPSGSFGASALYSAGAP